MTICLDDFNVMTFTRTELLCLHILQNMNLQKNEINFNVTSLLCKYPHVIVENKQFIILLCFFLSKSTFKHHSVGQRK